MLKALPRRLATRPFQSGGIGKEKRIWRVQPACCRQVLLRKPFGPAEHLFKHRENQVRFSLGLVRRTLSRQRREQSFQTSISTSQRAGR